MKTNVTRNAYCSVVIVGAVLVLFGVTGCETGPPESGFLSDYTSLQRVAEDAPVWDYIDPEGRRSEMKVKLWSNRVNWLDLGNYDKLHVDPVIVELHSGAEGAWVKQDRLDEMTQYMHDTIVEVFSERYAVVDETGPGVLRVRTAITDLYPSYRYRTPDVDQHPVKTWANSRPGGVTVETEVLDTATGELVLAFVFVGKGTDFGTLNTDQPWEQSKAGIRRMTRFVRDRMDDAHRIKAGQEPKMKFPTD